MKNFLSRVKQSYARPTAVIVFAFTILALALPAHADIAVKFFGEIEKDQLSPKFKAVVDNFFDNDSRVREGFFCYQGDLLDLQNGRKVGTGVDCLSIAGIDDHTTGDTDTDPLPPDFGQLSNTADVSAAVDAVTFFFLPGGYIVSDGLTTVRPFFEGIGNGDGTDDEGMVTHITGSVPGQTPNIVAATGRFSRLADTGNVRLSGAVNLGDAPDVLFLSCLFVINFDSLP